MLVWEKTAVSSCYVTLFITTNHNLRHPARWSNQIILKENDAFIPDKENIDDDLVLAKPTSGLQSGKW